MSCPRRLAEAAGTLKTRDHEASAGIEHSVHALAANGDLAHAYAGGIHDGLAAKLASARLSDIETGLVTAQLAGQAFRPT
jgi:hypothetical protein